MNAATRALRAEDPPGLHALADRVMNVVRAEVRLGRLLPLPDPDRDFRIAESTAAKVLRRAADTIRGARAATCRLVPEGEGTGVRVTMTLATALNRPLLDRVHQVRRSVFDSAPARSGTRGFGRRHHRGRRTGAVAASRAGKFRPSHTWWYVMTATGTTTLLGVAA
ncbi:hypothetical protein [Streptomyces avermitilis]|uniref:hypothetical protein n=1 Tax=Streptomyces avermitilis TaxID=33903 RepID=UPI00369C5986